MYDTSHLVIHAKHVIELSWVHVKSNRRGVQRSRSHPGAFKQAAHRSMKISKNSPQGPDEQRAAGGDRAVFKNDPSKQ